MHVAFGVEDKNPEPVELEPGDEHYLELFQKISTLRHTGMAGVEPIQPDQILSWCHLMGVSLTMPEVRLILDLDIAYRAALAREQERNRPKDQR